MLKNLTVLIVDTSRDRAEVLVSALRQGGFDTVVEQVDNLGMMEGALGGRKWDLVLAHPVLPEMTAFEALERVKAERIYLPFIVVSETMQEEEMVALIKAGADDYVLTNNLSRLVPVVERQLRAVGELRPGIGAERRPDGERLRQLTEAIGKVFWMTDIPKEKMLYVSPAYETIWGLSCESLYESPQSWLRSIHPDDQARVRKAALFKQSAGEYDEEYRIVRPDGSIRWIHDRAYPIRHDSGEVYRIVGIAEDITQRKRAEIQSAAFSALGFRLSSAGTAQEAARIIFDTAADLLGWDSCYLHLFTPDYSKLIPILTMDTIDGERVDVPSRPFTHGPTPMMNEVTERGAQLINREDKEAPIPLVPFGNTARRSASMMYVPIHRGDRAGGVLSIQSYKPSSYSPADLRTLQVLADHAGGALERINSREGLRQNEEQFRSLFELAPMAVAIHGPDGQYLKTNPAYQAMFGYSHHELQRLGVRRLTYPADIAEGQRLYQEVLNGQRHHYQREKRYVRRDGFVVWARSTALAVREGNGRLRHIISIVEDLTERKELADEILTAREKEQQRLGQDLHDGLCQNLIGLKFKGSLLEKKLQEKSLEEANDARAIARSLEKAVQLAYDLARGLQPVLLAREGLVCALEELASSTRSLFNVSCRFRSQGAVNIQNQTIITHMYRIAQECVANAIKHSRGTKLSIVLAEGPAQVLLWVSDNGIGSGANKGGSKGIGLGIMHHRAHMIDASLSIQTRLGGGTRVVCTLPKSHANDPSETAL